MNEQEKNPQVLFSWKAPLRPYVKRSKQIMRFYIALTLLLSLIVFFFGDRILLLPLWTLLFIFYVFTVTPPTEITHKISQFGVEITGQTLRWEDLDHFYFFKRFGYDVLVLVTHAPFPYYAYLVVPDSEAKKKVFNLLSEHIIYQEEPRNSFTDKAIDWFTKLVPSEEAEKKEEVPQTATPVSEASVQTPAQPFP
jgi:hypothetical protein